MGRKSSLTAEQWVEVERRAVVDGESINSLAAEFGINESSIRRKIKPNKVELPNGPKSLRLIAEKKVHAERMVKEVTEEITELPIARQQIVCDLARKMTSISEDLACAAEYGAATARKLSNIANRKIASMDHSAPLDEAGVMNLKGIAALTRMANEASEIGMNLARVNKETMDDLLKKSAQREKVKEELPIDPVEAAAAYMRMIRGD